MPNGIRCVNCGFYSTAHYDDDTFPQIDPNEEYKKEEQYGKIVCREYEPDIKDGDLKCDCNDRGEKEWCDGGCHFPERNQVEVL